MATPHSRPAALFDRMILGHPRAVIFLVLLGVGFLGYQARHFRLDASAETLVLENDEDLRYTRLVAARYGQSDFVVVTYTAKGDLFADRTLATLARLTDELSGLNRVASVHSILDVPLLESPPIALSAIQDGLPTLQSPETDRVAASHELSGSPLYRDLLISADARTTAVLVNFADDGVYDNLVARRDALRQKRDNGALDATGQAELARVVEDLRRHRDVTAHQRHEDIAAIRAIMDRYRGEADLFLGGVRMIADDMISFIRNDLRVFGLGAAAALLVMLGVIFRRLRWICLPILCCIASVVSLIGLLGWFRWDVTVISSNIISLQLILTMAIAVHLTVRYRELLARNPERPNRELVLDTVRLKLKPCLYATLTTIAGFGSLVLCDILPVIMLGWMMTVGLTVSLVLTFLLFPAALVLLPKDKPPRSNGRHASLTGLLARLTERRGALILGAGALVLAASLVGIAQLQVENSFIDYFHPNTEIHQGMKQIDGQLGGTIPLTVLVEFDDPPEPEAAVQPDTAEGDDFAEFDEFDELDAAATQDKYWFTREKMSRIEAVHAYLDGLPETGKVLSLATMLRVARKLNGGKALDSFELALLYSKTPERFKAVLVDPYVSVEHNQARIWLRVRDSDRALRRNALLEKIKADLPDVAGVGRERVHVTGLLVLYNNMLQSLFRSQILTVGVTVCVLAVVFLAVFRSWRIALVSMFPNLLPVAAVLGAMGWLGMPLDMMTITIAAIAVGIAVDDTIHYIHRFGEEFRKDRRYLAAMHRCHDSIGRAMYYTSITITIGLCVLMLSNFIPTVRFGLLTAVAMMVAFLADLTLLPRMLILAKAFGKET